MTTRYKTHGKIEFGLVENATGQAQSLEEILDSVVTDGIPDATITAPSGVTSAVSRPMVNQIGDRPTAKQMGCTGDGSTDDATKLQAALDALAAGDIAELHFPIGDYVFATGLTYTAPDSDSDYVSSHAPRISCAAPELTRLRYTATSGTALTLAGTITGLTLAGNLGQCLLDGLTLEGPGISGNTANGIVAQGFSVLAMRGVKVREFGNYGVWLKREHYGDGSPALDDHGSFVKLDQCEITRCGEIGLLCGSTYEVDHILTSQCYFTQHAKIAAKINAQNYIDNLSQFRGAAKSLWLYNNNVSFSNQNVTLISSRFENTVSDWQLGVDTVQGLLVFNVFFVGTSVSTMVKLSPTAGQTIKSASFKACRFFADSGGGTTAFDLASSDATAVINGLSVDDPIWVGSFANQFLNAQSRRFRYTAGEQFISTGATLPSADFIGAASTDQVARFKVSSETNARIAITPGGIQWGDGTSAPSGLQTVRGASGRITLNGTELGNAAGPFQNTASRTAAQVGDKTDDINTKGKWVGKAVWVSDSTKPLWASGTAATSPWVDATGTTAITPA